MFPQAKRLLNIIVFFCLLGIGQICFAQLENDLPFSLPPLHEIAKLRSAKLATSKGDLIFELFPDQAPYHVANFKYLADRGFYTNKTFHLFRAGYIIQGGAAGADPDSGPGYELPPEFSERHHERGILGMARRPDELNQSRSSHGSQFHILLGDASHMDGNYTIFGKLVKGHEVLDKLELKDRILSLTVYVRAGGKGSARP